MKTLIALGALAMVAASQADSTIDTLSGWNGTDSIFNFGPPDTQTYGQTFKTPVGSPLLMTYEFQLMSSAVDNGFHAFNLYVMGWDSVNQHASGSVLYKSGDQFLVDTGTWQDFVVAPNVMLTPGSEYVAFISTSENAQDSWAAFQAGRGGSDVYSDGQFFFINNGTNTAAWTNNSWSAWTTNDTAFKAVFCGTVPEPASMAALAMGAVALIRRKRNSK